jgi:hypothetical protein
MRIMAKPKARNPIKALTAPLYGIFLPAAATNADEARRRRGEWVTISMLVTACDETVGTKALWRSRAGARRECEAFYARYPRSACIDAEGVDYGQHIKQFCRLGDLRQNRGRPKKKLTDIGRLIAGPDPAEAIQEVAGARAMTFIERLCAKRDAKMADATARKIMDGVEAEGD